MEAKEVKTIFNFSETNYEENSSNSFISDTLKKFPVMAMSSKDAAFIIPKWSTPENIVSFCKKIESASISENN